MWPPASIPSITSASAPLRISFLASAERGGEGDQFRAIALDPVDRTARRKPAREHDMGHFMRRADVDQLADHRVHGDEVDAERFRRALLRLGDLGVEQVGGHRPARDHPEAARIGDGGDEVALADPAHRPAENGDLAAEEIGPAVHQFLEAAEPFAAAVHRAGLRDHAFTAHASFPVSSSPKAVWSRRTASSISSSRINALTLISLVVTASRLIPRAASVSNIVADKRGVGADADPDDARPWPPHRRSACR